MCGTFESPETKLGPSKRWTSVLLYHSSQPSIDTVIQHIPERLSYHSLFTSSHEKGSISTEKATFNLITRRSLGIYYVVCRNVNNLNFLYPKKRNVGLLCFKVNTLCIFIHSFLTKNRCYFLSGTTVKREDCRSV